MKKFEWDDPFPQEMQLVWGKLFRKIEDLKTVQFPRCLQSPSPIGSPELHVFADASNLGYGAASYLVWSSSGGKEARLVSAKARVAPLRQTTIPRLELMAALLAMRLAKTIYKEFKIRPSNVTLWSDYMIVLTYGFGQNLLCSNPLLVSELRKSKRRWTLLLGDMLQQTSTHPTT